LLHKQRTWCVSPVANPEELAKKVTEHTWTLCTGFQLGDWLFLNDSFSEDGAQEYGVVHQQQGKLIQVESVTFGWMTEESVLTFIRKALAGELEVMYGEVALQLQTPENHGRCPLCA
jgi:hypothetical protein